MTATAAPEQIGQYTLDAELGRGAFGIVYRAHHVDRPEESVALKVIDGRGHLDRSMLEPALLAKLDHPCVVGIEDYFRDGDRLILALELVDGEDLKTLLDRGEIFSQAQIRDFLIQMAGALAAAHAQQIVHRDIKPSNILMDRAAGRLRFVLTDFGIGRQDEGIQDRKHTGGTYLFMAPEQLRGRPAPQSDLWAVGVVAYRLLTGKMPFPGPSLPELSRQILYDSPTPPAQICAEPVDPELETVILRLLDKSLQERVTSAEELLRLLGFQGQPGEVLSRTTKVQHKPAAGETIERGLARRIFWRKLLLGAAIGVYLLPPGPITATLLLGGLWLFFKGQTARRWPRRQRILALGLALVLFAGHTVVRQLNELQMELALLIGTDAAHVIRADSARTGRGPSGATPEVRTSHDCPRRHRCVGGHRRLLRSRGRGGGLRAVAARAAREVAARRRLDREYRLRPLSGDAARCSRLSLCRRRLSSEVRRSVVAHGRHADAAVEGAIDARTRSLQLQCEFAAGQRLLHVGTVRRLRGFVHGYLDVSGYCFEFAELRDQCRRKEAGQ